MLLYIDPGTGSMLFTILLGVLTTLYYIGQKLILKIKFRLSAGGGNLKEEKKNSIVIFSDSKVYWNVFKPICDEFERRRIAVDYWTASPDDEALNLKYDFVNCMFIGEGNKAFAKLNMMDADICLATTPGLDVLQWKRSRNTKYYVHILHASGTSAAGYRMFSLDFYDAVLLTGDYQIDEIRELEEKRQLPAKDLKVVGCTYMDELKKKLDSSEQEEHSNLTVLLAPSWGQSSILNRYEDTIIKSLVNTGYNIVIRPHPQSFKSEKDLIERLKKQFPESDTLSWNQDNDNFDILNKSDIMISDFSSVIFDYSLVFNKPFIYAESTFDNSIYDAAWLDDEMWKFKVLPKIGIPLRESDFDNMKEIIDKAIVDESLYAAREQARSEAWAHIGESAKLTVDYLIAKREELNESADS